MSGIHSGMYLALFCTITYDITSSAIAANELAGPISVEDSIFPLNVELLEQSLTADGSKRALQAGMTLTANIIVDERPLWRVFMDPVMDLHG